MPGGLRGAAIVDGGVTLHICMRRPCCGDAGWKAGGNLFQSQAHDKINPPMTTMTVKRN